MTDLENLIREVETKKKNLELESRFQRNLSLLEQVAPDLRSEYAHYRPETIKLTLAPEGYVNLVNTDLDNKPVYPEQPETFTEKYVRQYRQMPTTSPVRLQPHEKVLDIDNDAHMKHNNAIIHAINATRRTPVKHPLPEAPSLMIVLGVGLGYHLEQLLSEHNIRHLIVIEPNRDIFHASLHTCEWERVFRAFSGEDRSLQLILGRTPTETVSLVRQQIHRIGAHNAAHTYVFDHLSSQEHKSALRQALLGITKTISTLGYFDDERVGLAHTVDNLRKNPPILCKHTSLGAPPIKQRVFIVANGPSLDAARDYLQQHRNSALIISCGTALGSLAKLGIKPHIHVEMERTRPVVEWIENATDPEFRRDIRLVALNTVHPDVLELFDHTYVALKPNDLGTDYVKKLIKPDAQLVQLPNSNPTVGNTAVALAASLGAPEIYLFGMDLGFSSGEQHHSSLSKHYDIKEEHVEGLNLYQHDAKENITAQGNFGDKITTNTVYMNSKLSLEQVVEQSPNSRFFNTSKGLRIEGATPMPIEKLEDFPPEETMQEKVDYLFQTYFSRDALSRPNSKQAVITDFQPAIDILKELTELMTPPASTLEECHQMVERQYQAYRNRVAQEGYEHVHGLLKGSVENFTLSLTLALHTELDEEDTVNLFNECTQSYLAFLKEARAKVRSELLKLDQRSRDIAQKSA